MGEPNEEQDVKTSVKKEETSGDKTETFTKEQLEEAKRNAKSDGLAEVGRLKTENQKLVTNQQKLNVRIDKFYKDQDEAELEANRDKPDQLSAIKERQSRRTAESDLDSVTQERDELKEKQRGYDELEAKSKKEKVAIEVASRLDVDVKRLTKLAEFTDGSTEVIEEIASELPKKGDKKELYPDSGKTIGGRDWERVQEAFIKNPDDKKNKERYLEMRKAQGR